MEPSVIHVRIKRDKRTYFFECQPFDSVELLKKKLQNFYKNDSNEMRLFYGTRLLDDKANLFDQDVKNDSEFMLKLKKNTTDWED